MAYQIKVPAETPIVEIFYEGDVTPAELAACVDEAIRAVTQHRRVRVLTDCSKLRGGHSLTNLFNEVEKMLSLPMPEGYREAIVVPADKDVAAKVRFWETACVNRGVNVRLFAAPEAARAWLAE
jgi:SpoIIAA-like